MSDPTDALYGFVHSTREVHLYGLRQIGRGDRVIEAPSPSCPTSSVGARVVTVTSGGHWAEGFSREFVPENGEWWDVTAQPCPRPGRLVRNVKACVTPERVLVCVPGWEHPEYDPKRRGQMWE